MNLRTFPVLFLTTTPESIKPNDSERRILMISKDYEVVGALRTFCRRTSVIALRAHGESDQAALLAEIWAAPKRRAHTVVVLAPPSVIYDLAMEIDRTSWEAAMSILGRGGIIAFERGRFVTHVPSPRSAEDLLKRHPVFDIDLD